MSNQKVMRVFFQHPTTVSVGDIIQCPACRWKFVVMPEVVTAPYPYIPCPKCLKNTDLSYYITLSCTGGIELTNWGKPEPKPKEAKSDGQSRSRKGVSKQCTGVKDGDQAHPKKTRSSRGKGA